jgi:two-component system LytT family response regulator
MIRTVIIEDEFNALGTLKKLIDIISNNIIVVGESDNVDDAILLIQDIKPDLVFLDIELIGGNAFQVLDRCTDCNFKVIFTTAYEQFAIRAFKFDTFDYLLKPIDLEELETCLSKLEKMLAHEKKMSEALDYIKETEFENADEKLLVKTVDNQFIVSINDIIRCQSDGSYTMIYTTDMQILTSRNLKYYEGILHSHIFVRVHQSHLVNLKYVKSIKSSHLLTLTDSSEVPVSTRKKAFLKELLKQ